MITQFILVVLIVGIVTAGLKIRFDRFFAIILLLFIMEKSIHQSIDIFLWIIALGAATVLFQNKTEIAKMEPAKKKKMLLFIPAMTFIFAGVGSYFYSIASTAVLTATLALLALLFGLRLILVHFKEHEFSYQNEKPGYAKLCGLAGPVISGLSLGFIGSSLKSLKIPLGVRLGKMNIQQVYFSNVVITFFAASSAIIWHKLLITTSNETFFNNFLLGTALWVGIHYVYKFADIFFPNKWKKAFQIIIGLALLVASIRIFNLI